MDISELQAFLAVADKTSFSQAAERLFLTQPAISKRIASLEAELGTKLFDRIGRRVSLTEAGLALLPRARHILDEIDDSRRAIANLAGKIEGRLTFATSHHIGLRRLPPVLRRYHRRYPHVALDIQFMDSEQACQAVLRGELELAIVTLPTLALNKLDIQTVWHDQLTVMVAVDHPLAELPSLSLQELARWQAIMPAQGTYTREIIESAFARHTLQIEASMSTNYLETIRMLVAVGLGWSVLPLTMLDEQLIALNLSSLHMSRALGVVSHTRRSLSNAACALRSLLAEETTE